MENKTFKVNLEKDRPIINILGEICWGFQIENFEKKIGVKKEIAEALLEKLLKEEKTGVVEVFLTESDVNIIKRAFTEVSREIEKWEFPIRLGISLEEASQIEILKPENN